jgi:hypothetical protein
MAGPEQVGAGRGGAHAAPARVPGQSTILASELGGDLPCFRCKYNLKGLSIRAVCPECAMPVKATLLAVVDPLAGELRPIPRPLPTASGVVAWSFGALAAAMCAWAAQGLSYWTGEVSVHHLVGGLGLAVVLLTALSGLGSLALVKPHDGIPLRMRRLALIGALAYVPLVLAMWWLYVDSGVVGRTASSVLGLPIASERSELRILTDGIMILILVGLRPNARLLAARSLLMRTGRVDRQTMLALVGVLCVGMLGDAAVVVSNIESLPAAIGEGLAFAGTLVVLVASVLFTIGLIGVALDCWRMRPVIAESPVSLARVLDGDPPPAPAPRAAAKPT